MEYYGISCVKEGGVCLRGSVDGGVIVHVVVVVDPSSEITKGQRTRGVVLEHAEICVGIGTIPQFDTTFQTNKTVGCGERDRGK